MECARKREKCSVSLFKKRQRYRFRSKSEISLSTFYKLYILAQNDANKKNMQSKKALGFKRKKKGFKFGLVRGRNPVQILDWVASAQNVDKGSEFYLWAFCLSAAYSFSNLGLHVEDFSPEACLILSSEVSASAPCFVFEYGSANEEPHLHFYFESAKSLSKCQSALKNMAHTFR
jgi:hypothetical protein